MSLQENRVNFFEKFSSELCFLPATPSIQEIISSVKSSFPTHLNYRDVSSGETFEGSFYLEKSFLLFYQAETMEFPKILLDLSYAQLNTISRRNQKPAILKMQFKKNNKIYKISFYDEGDYDDWMLKLRKICVLTDFDKKYQIAEIIEKKGDVCECLLETKMGGNHYSARKFDKEQITSSKSSLAAVRLMNEIETLRALKNKRVLNLCEVYETEDLIYLVTNYVHNITLKKILKAASSPFDEARAKTIMYQLFNVLAQMASMKIVHRNLKPSSILMEGQHSIRIINFGLATYVNGHKANVGICGTPGYIAPEILNSHHGNRVYDDKADVFSAGCIFFEVLFGYPLFKGSKTSEISILNKNFQYSDLIQLVMKEQKNKMPLSTKLGLDLLLKLLHNDPKQRISAKEALRNAYFRSQEDSDSSRSSEDESEASPKNSQSNSPQNNRKRVSFDLSPSYSISPGQGSFSEAVSYQERSSLYPSDSSLRRSSVGNSGRCARLSIFKSQPKFNSEGEMKLPIPPKRFSENISSEALARHKIGLCLQENQNEEDSDNIFDESSPLNLSKNHPIESPRIKKHPDQRIP